MTQWCETAQNMITVQLSLDVPVAHAPSAHAPPSPERKKELMKAHFEAHGSTSDAHLDGPAIEVVTHALKHLPGGEGVLARQADILMAPAERARLAAR